jgi:hypothetical protein
MAYRVVKPEAVIDGKLRGRTFYHIAELWSSRTLCGEPADPGDGWEELTDWHPEDVDALDRCSHCYYSFEKRRAQERQEHPRLLAGWR